MPQKKGLIVLMIVGSTALIAIPMGGNALTSTDEGQVDGVIVRQWVDTDCRRGANRNSRCTKDYNNRVELPDGSRKTFDRQSWYHQKNTGDRVTLNKRRGGWFRNIYYVPQ